MHILSQLKAHLLPLLTLVAVSVALNYPQLQGKSIKTHDIAQHQSSTKELQDYLQKEDRRIYWTNAIFGGMPTYQMGNIYTGNLLKHIERIPHLLIKRPTGYFIGFCLLAYLALVFFGLSPWLAVAGALMIAFNTSNLLTYSSGHMTKMRVLMYSTPLILGAYLALAKHKWYGVALYGLGLGVAVLANHPQMLYYALIGLIPLGLASIVEAWRSGQLPVFGTRLAALVGITLVAVATGASNVLPTIEYAKDTMRGEPILSDVSASGSESSSVEGLDWTYATNWSNGVLDLMAGIVPGAAGGSNGHLPPRNSATIKKLKSRGANVSADTPLPLYWGAMNSTGGAFYFGVIVMFLFAVMLLSGPRTLAIWLGSAVLIMAIMSMGRNAAWFNRLLFDYLPYFNKFRAPNSISPVIALYLGVGASIGLYQIITRQSRSLHIQRTVLYAGAGLAAICAFFLLIGPSVFDFAGANDAAYGQRGFDIGDLKADRISMMRQDALRSFLFLLAAAGGSWFYLTKRLSPYILVGAVAILALIDSVGIGRRYMPLSKFSQPQRVEQANAKRPVDEQILSREPHRGAYRVLDMSLNTYNDNSSSYWHNTIGGYHPAKLQRFEDVKNRYLLTGNINAINMLNGKYIISRDGKLQTNGKALGNAWFVNNIKWVSTPEEEIGAIEQTDVGTTAILDEGCKSDVNEGQLGSGVITLSSYDPEQLVYKSTNTTGGLAVFSEIYYGPDKGWKATIDGEEVPILRANYLLRAVQVPPGTHEVILSFEPNVVGLGRTLSLVSSVLLLLIIGYLLYRYPPEYLQDLRAFAPATATVSPKERTTKAKRKVKASKKKKK